jgi:leader peptidase (prepilin peptidase)/N-methyltransferase
MIPSPAVEALALAALLSVGSVMDFRCRRLPDLITLPLIVAGFGSQFVVGGTDGLGFSLLGATLGFIAFWAIAKLYRLSRGTDGLGLGDAKLLAAAGAWLGPMFLAPIVFVGAILALLFVQVLRLRGEGISAQTIIPFGPFLSAAFFGFWCLKAAGWSWLS